jgi:hypothetical protein
MEGEREDEAIIIMVCAGLLHLRGGGERGQKHVDELWREYLVCSMDASPVNYKNLQPIGKGRIEGGTSGREKEFWDRARSRRLAWEDVTRQRHGT